MFNRPASHQGTEAFRKGFSTTSQTNKNRHLLLIPYQRKEGDMLKLMKNRMQNILLDYVKPSRFK